MGWVNGRYYRRQHWQGGTCRTEYIGSGAVARLIAQMDAEARMARQSEARDRRAQLSDSPALAQYRDLTRLLMDAACLANGYHQHERGEWRKRREPIG